MGPSGIREEKSKWGQSGEIRMLGFRRLFSKTQTEHVSPSPGLPEKTTAEQLNDLAQHLHQCATVSHRHRCVSSSSVSSDGKWSRGSCWQISAPLTGLTWWCILMNVKSKLKSDSSLDVLWNPYRTALIKFTGPCTWCQVQTWINLHVDKICICHTEVSAHLIWITLIFTHFFIQVSTSWYKAIITFVSDKIWM